MIIATTVGPLAPRDLTIELFDAINDPNLQLQAWNEVQAELERIKALEMHMRKAMAAAYFPDATYVEGTKNFDLGGGYKLKALKKLNYRLGDNDKVNDALDAITALGDEGKFLAERLVSFDPRLSVSEYKAIAEGASNKNLAAIKAIIDGVLTIVEGAPTLEIVAPKTK